MSVASCFRTLPPASDAILLPMMGGRDVVVRRRAKSDAALMLACLMVNGGGEAQQCVLSRVRFCSRNLRLMLLCIDLEKSRLNFHIVRIGFCEPKISVIIGRTCCSIDCTTIVPRVPHQSLIKLASLPSSSDRECAEDQLAMRVGTTLA